jgi:hypothetical protein
MAGRETVDWQGKQKRGQGSDREMWLGYFLLLTVDYGGHPLTQETGTRAPEPDDVVQ